MSQIINEINPNPVLSAGIEIRFQSSSFKTQDEVLPFFFPIFKENLSKFKDRRNPDIILRDNQPTYFADYSFNDGKFSVGVGQNVILFEIIKDYPLWDVFFDFVKSSLSDIRTEGLIVDKVERIGLRYISVLPKKDRLEESTEFNASLKFHDFKQSKEFVKTEYSNESGMSITAQVGNGMQTIKDGLISEPLLYIDLDISTTNVETKAFDDSLFLEIDKLHTLEKDFFTKLLKESYKTTLDIKYKLNG